MRGFSFIIVLIFIIAIVPIVALDGKIADSAEKMNTKFIQYQNMKNTRDDIIRTFTEMARDCKKSRSKKLCAIYFSEWKTYWESKGFTITSGKIEYFLGVPGVVRKVAPRIEQGVLTPSDNVSSFGIILKNKDMEVMINRGAWA